MSAVKEYPSNSRAFTSESENDDDWHTRNARQRPLLWNGKWNETKQIRGWSRWLAVERHIKLLGPLFDKVQYTGRRTVMPVIVVGPHLTESQIPQHSH